MVEIPGDTFLLAHSSLARMSSFEFSASNVNWMWWQKPSLARFEVTGGRISATSLGGHVLIVSSVLFFWGGVVFV